MPLATWVKLSILLLFSQAQEQTAEEIESASEVIPRSMLASVGINGLLGFSMLVATLFCLGDEEAVMNTPTRFPFIAVFNNAAKSSAGTSVMVYGDSYLVIKSLNLHILGLRCHRCHDLLQRWVPRYILPNGLGIRTREGSTRIAAASQG